MSRNSFLRQGSLRGITKTQMVMALALVVTLGLVTYGFVARPDPNLIVKPLTKAVLKAPFEHVVAEQGEIESSSNIEIRCEVKSRGMSGITILEVVPEGTTVQQGDVLVRLDSTALDQEQISQQIACNTAEAASIETKNKFEAAKIAKVEYLEATYKQEEQIVLSEVFVAEQNMRTAKLAYDSSVRLALRGIVTQLQLEGDQFSVDKARKDLEAANIKLEGLRKYTRDKMIKQLEADIASAEAKWKADQKGFELESAKLKDIEEQIAKCTIRAPRPGQVVYANKVSQNRGGSSAEFVVEAGAVVREQQPIIRLPDSNAMQIKATINEARINSVRPGMPVSIRVDALRDEKLNGEVTKVNQYAEPGGWAGGNVKKYATFVRIKDPPPELRAGMNAEVRIFVERLPEAIQVPVQAIAEYKEHFFCLVETGDMLETKEIKRGASNDKFMVVLDGVKEGDNVVLDPRSRAELKFPDNIPDPVPVVKTVSAPEATPVAAKEKEEPKGKKGGRGNGPPSAGDLITRWLESDANKDGKLQASEIDAMTDERSKRGLAEADTNKDTELDKAELTAAAGKAVARIRQFMQQQQGGGAGGGGPPSGGGQ